MVQLWRNIRTQQSVISMLWLLLGVISLIRIQEVKAEDSADVLREIPDVHVGAKRLIVLDDLLRLRDIDSLSVSPDGSHYAILLRQAVPERNTYRTGWFVGDVSGGSLVFVGDGGDARLLTFPDGTTVGDIAGGPGRWSPDGQWLTYLLKRGGETQLWRSRRDGRVTEQLTHNASDVRDFAWSDDGRKIYFTAGTPRAQMRSEEQLAARQGYHFGDFTLVGEIASPGHPPRPLEENPIIWIVDLKVHSEHTANAEERRAFDRLRSSNYRWGASGAELPEVRNGAAAKPVVSSKGTWAWLASSADHPSSNFPLVRVTVSNSPNGAHPMSCEAPECSGEYIDALWWSADGDDVLFWNLDRQTGAEQALYSWTPSTGSVSELVHASSDVFIACAIAVEKLLCLRETGTRPRHVAAIDARTGTITVVADVNPELKNIQFGRIERIEWAVPNIVPNLYPPRAYGYILYPPDFDPARKYPVFIAPYGAWGFHRGDIGDEHPLFVYAAHGIVVLHTTFPSENTQNMTDKDLMKLLFSSERGYPYLTTMMESTLAALDLVVTRGFVDEKGVGIGGLSQGSQNPLYMLAKSNRIAAASVAGGYMGSWLYYAKTPRGQPRSEEWYPAPVGEGWKWWASIDVAQQANKITAPILFNFSDQDVFNSTTLLRHLEDAHKPFDAYVFPGEYHEKWQPAHRAAIYSRNLDWFRFWLKGEEDPDPAKAEQYKRWRELRKLQQTNNTAQERN